MVAGAVAEAAEEAVAELFAEAAGVRELVNVIEVSVNGALERKLNDPDGAEGGRALACIEQLGG